MTQRLIIDTDTASDDAVALLMAHNWPGAAVEAITVWPMFLGTGRHAREDLPRLMEQLRARHARVRFTLRPAIAEHPDVLQAMACAALEPGAP